MNATTQALLGALEFMARIGTDNPPNEYDRQTKLSAVRAALLKRMPDIKRDPYYGHFFREGVR